MTIRKLHSADAASPPPNPTLRERALATYNANSVAFVSTASELASEEGQRAIYELQVHQIELEMQNEELLQSRTALEDSRARYRDLYDHAPVGYCLVSNSGIIQEANNTLAEMLKTSTIFLDGRLFCTLIDNDYQDAFYLLCKRILTTTQPQSCELRIKRSDGKLTWVQLSASFAKGDVKEGVMRVALMDIDARIRAEVAKSSLEAQLRESQKMEAVGRLAGGIAHDFNNVLTIILGNAELARRYSEQSDSPTFECIDEIRTGAERARELIKQLLSFSRQQPIARSSIALAPIIADNMRMLRSTMPARVNIFFTCGDEVPNVLADCTQIGQIIMNLATNALQAMDGGPGSIKIHLDTISRNSESTDATSIVKSDHGYPSQLQTAKWQKFDEVVRLTFSDDGHGMDDAIIKRIFEPFFTTKPIDQGTGLGLAVVHRIISTHGGEIAVKSQLGQGTTFTIYFPPALATQIESSIEESPIDQQFLASQFPAESNPSQRYPQRSILYLDDEPMVLNSMIKLLGHAGLQVHGYSDQQTALNFLHSAATRVDVVVTDYNMPGLSGLDVAKKVREIRPDLPVIIASGFIDEELRSQAEEAGVKALISKPFSTKAFCDLVQQLSPPSN